MLSVMMTLSDLLVRFSTLQHFWKSSVSQKRCKTDSYLLFNINRKSHVIYEMASCAVIKLTVLYKSEYFKTVHLSNYR